MRDANTNINYQVMSVKNDKGEYMPDFDELKANAENAEELKYIEKAEKNCKEWAGGFAYNAVFIVQYKCGHYEILQSPVNEHYPLERVLKTEKEHAMTSKCTRCICGMFMK